MSGKFSNEYYFRNEDIFDVWYNEGNSNIKTAAVLSFILNAFGETDISERYRVSVHGKVRLLCKHILSKWKNANRSSENFRSKYSVWLGGYYILPKGINPINHGTSAATGRPRLSYQEKSARSQRREAATRSNEMHEDLNLTVHATSITARKRGNQDLAFILKETTKSPGRAKQMREALFDEKEKAPTPLSLEEAMVFIYENNLSKRQYINIRLENKRRNCDIYPKYDAIIEARKDSVPMGVTVTETIAKVPLQNLLEHTVKRIVLLQEEVIQSVFSKTENEIVESEIIFSYGIDGSSSHSIYKQKFDSNGKAGSDCNLLATTLIPLRFCTNSNIILWNNIMSHSIRFCRPLKLEYVKETPEQILREKEDLDHQIRNLTHLNLSYRNKILKINFKLVMTLIDGKVLNTITKTISSQHCPICGATPTQLLKIDDCRAEEFTPKENTLQYGISPLHAWIRVFECIIHIAYRIGTEKWQVKEEKDKERCKSRKKEIQKLFWEHFGLHVDKPKQGTGNTNDGNTVRRAFQQPEMLSDITGVDLGLIKNLRIILLTISCQFPINLEKFETFCFETAKLYKEKYSWYPMPPTLHKILIHGKQIIQQSILPLGYLAEDAAESRNKCYRYDREFHARKNSRKNNLLDVFNRAMETSDPYISSISLKTRRQKQYIRKPKLPSGVLSLLASPYIDSDPSSTFTSTASEITDDEHGDIEDCDEIFPILQHLDDIQLQSVEV